MSASETTSLLPNGNGSGSHPNPTFAHRVKVLLAAEGEPTWLQSYRFFLFGSYLNLFLLFVPLSAVAHYMNLDAALRFSFSFIAIIPLAKLLGEATEQMSAKLGQTLAGLLNASFGNAVEIIVGVAALLQDEIRIVQTSMLGSILSNLLLVLGCSFLAAGTKFKESNFQVTAAQASSSLMTLACITLVIPAAYQNTISASSDEKGGLLVISRGTALILLGVYVAYLFFQLKSHAYLFEAEEAETEEPHMSVVAAGSALLVTTVVTSFCADFLVASIEETAERYHIPKAFIGLILLPIVANAAEHVTAVWMAMKGQMELTIGICVGSSIQIAALVVPLLVIVGWTSGHELTLFFANFETVTLFVSVFLVNTLIQRGREVELYGGVDVRPIPAPVCVQAKTG
ncbi:Sodium/calcium exchanger protein-domain-containing protein [Mycena belliarum]|uniref:Vacuolar calcium ion transporter n=1 Tax=Mycena belliarum TaxID=1033014 RepID=A0AAD6U046_9AGAR|nr:Sodium/calcium exchanger protein-domain-containing protein [Mycena belliae]